LADSMTRAARDVDIDARSRARTAADPGPAGASRREIGVAR